jgi:hypothetical protein
VNNEGVIVGEGTREFVGGGREHGFMLVPAN